MRVGASVRPRVNVRARVRVRVRCFRVRPQVQAVLDCPCRMVGENRPRLGEGGHDLHGYMHASHALWAVMPLPYR